MNHPLHKVVGDIIQEDEFPNCTIIKDHACGGNQNIPLFYLAEKRNNTRYCSVDVLILKNDVIRAIIEIEKTNTRPTQICGKFLTSVLSSYFIHKTLHDNPKRMGNSVSFIQIVDTSKLKMGRTSKIIQWKYIEQSINNILPIKKSNIGNYKLFWGTTSDFKKENKRKELINYVRKVLK